MNLGRWFEMWGPTLQGGVALHEVGKDDSFAFLVRSIGLPRHRALGLHFREKKVLVLTPPMMMRLAEEEFFAAGTTPRVRSIYKAARGRPERFTKDIEAIVIDCTFGPQTTLFLGLRRLIEGFDGPVVTMGHFQVNSHTRPPKEAASALGLQGKPPGVSLVWFPPLDKEVSSVFDKGGFAESFAKAISDTGLPPSGERE